MSCRSIASQGDEEQSTNSRRSSRDSKVLDETYVEEILELTALQDQDSSSAVSATKTSQRQTQDANEALKLPPSLARDGTRSSRGEDDCQEDVTDTGNLGEKQSAKATCVYEGAGRRVPPSLVSTDGDTELTSVRREIASLSSQKLSDHPKALERRRASADAASRGNPTNVVMRRSTTSFARPSKLRRGMAATFQSMRGQLGDSGEEQHDEETFVGAFAVRGPEYLGDSSEFTTRGEYNSNGQSSDVLAAVAYLNEGSSPLTASNVVMRQLTTTMATTTPSKLRRGQAATFESMHQSRQQEEILTEDEQGEQQRQLLQESIVGAFAVRGPAHIGDDTEFSAGLSTNDTVSSELLTNTGQRTNLTASAPSSAIDPLRPSSDETPTILSATCVGTSSEFVKASLLVPPEQELENDDTIKLLKKRRAYLQWTLAATVLLALVAIALIVIFTVGWKPQEQRVTSAPSLSPTLSPIARRETLTNIVYSVTSPDDLALSGTTSPQRQALEWLIERDPLALSPPHDTEERIIQRYALAVIYFTTGGGSDEWVRSFDFITGDDECTWSEALACNEDGFVTVIDLVSNGLVGSIPSELFAMTHLVQLELGENHLSGVIPSDGVGRLSMLEIFDVAESSLTGPIPADFWALTNLETLRISNNGLSGSFPTVIGLFQRLAHIHTNGNKMNGSLPRQLYDLPNLETLHISRNSYTGMLTTGLSRLGKLSFVSANLNQFTGSLPAEWGSMTQLTELKIASNRITGTLPTEYGQLTFLKRLSVNNNAEIGGTIPSEYVNLTSLQRLRVDSTQVYGDIDFLCDALQPREAQFRAVLANVTCSCCSCCGQQSE